MTSISLFAFANEPAHEAKGDINAKNSQEEHTLVGHGTHEIKGKSGANLTLFPTKQQDFTKMARPAKPTLTEPAYKAVIAGDSVTLKWNAVENANAYHVQVATDPAFKWLVSDNWNVSGNSFDQKNLQAGKSYFWRVAAISSANEPTYMKGWFSVNTFVTK